MPTCRTCQFLDVPPDKAGRIRPRSNYTYRCLAPDPVMPVMPASITTAYGFSWPPCSRSYMHPDEGEGCPTYEARKAGQGPEQSLQ